jgi:hypothetical protein
VTDLAGSLRAAQDASSANEYIRRVKASVTEEMQRIDPSVEIEDTSYFNHSAIPDLIVKWSRDADTRSVYLRGSYAAIVAGRDTEFITTGRPILLALDPSMQSAEPGDITVSPQRLSDDAAIASATLITDSEAMGTLGDPPSPTETPLGPLVRANYLQGGKGLIDPDRARLLVRTGTRNEEARVALETAVRENFLPDAAIRLQRTAQVIDVALGQAETTEVGGSAAMIAGGRLTTVELRAILPWLMRQDGLTEDRGFWGRLGDLFDLAMLEKVAAELADVDLSRLLRANANKWTARRSYLGLVRDEEEAIPAPIGSWHFRGGVLGVDFAEQRVSIATSGRTLPGRDSTGSPLWNDLSSMMSGFRVVAATLRGVTRSISVTAEESDDVGADVADIVQSVEDSFRVEKLTVRVPDQPSGDPADIEVNFSRGIATASPSATVSDLIRVSGRLVSFRQAIAGEEIVNATSDEEPT